MYLRVSAKILGIQIDTSNTTSEKVYSIELLNGTARLIPDKSEGANLQFSVEYDEKLTPPINIKLLLNAFCDGKRPDIGKKATLLEHLKIRDGEDCELDSFPEELANYLKQVKANATQRVKSFVSVLRWRFNLDSKAKPISSLNAYCSRSLDGPWIYISDLEYRINFGVDKRVSIENVISPDFLEFFGSSDSEPIGHELYREARDILSVSKRGALVLGVASVEVRLKELIGESFPNVNWLITEVQSPPLVKIFKHYIPELFEEHKISIDSFRKTKHMTQITKAIELRNNISHRGADADKGWIVVDFIDSAEQFVWFCDFLAGYHWAENHFDQITKKCFISTPP